MKKFALLGNPNSGKTTLFNLLTGATAYVGNWPGVTVDKREGTYRKGDEPVELVDLPGIYSLSPYTPEEVISRNFILDERPDCVINVVDATNLERNLYLTTQLIEIDVPVVVALNMMDALEKAGDKIDVKKLEERIGVPVVEVSALKNLGVHELMARALEVCTIPRKGETVLKHSPIAHLIQDVTIALTAQNVSAPLFHAVKLSELDELEVEMHPALVAMVNEFKATFSDSTFGTDFEAIVADARYKYISEHYASTVTKKYKAGEKLTRSDKVDRVLTHRIWGIPIFAVILFAVFHLTFSEDFLFLSGIFGGLPTLEELGLPTENYAVSLLACLYDGAVFSPGVIFTNLLNWILQFFNVLAEMAVAGAPAWLQGFIVDGILGGIFAVLGFLPQILTLFLFFSILEDSGYMARVAFILDRFTRRLGLSGRALMPMIMGFGCSVPAMINTRTLADEREKTVTLRVIPFFSCGAKLPILTAIAGGIIAYFNVGNADLITFGMYVLGVTSALVAILVMRSTTMRSEIPPFIMEFPAYHRPLFLSLMVHLWDKAKHFVEKAFTIILASTILVWFLSHFTFSWSFLPDERMNESILANLGMLIQPLFTPLGFGSQLNEFGWIFAVATLTGLIAKENVIATFGTIATCLGFAVSEGLGEGVGEAVAMIGATGINVPALVAFIAFNMTTVPCFAACATARAELPKGKFHLTLIFWVIASYLVASVVYVVGSWWWTAFIFLAAFALAIFLIVLWNKKHPLKHSVKKGSEEAE